MKSVKLFGLLAALLLLFACTSKDKENPVVTIDAPLSTASFVVGDTMHLSVTGTDETQLHGVELEVTCDCQTDALYYSHTHTEDASLHVHDEVVLSVTQNSTVTVKATAEDEAGNSSSEMLSFQVN